MAGPTYRSKASLDMHRRANLSTQDPTVSEGRWRGTRGRLVSVGIVLNGPLKGPAKVLQFFDIGRPFRKIGLSVDRSQLVEPVQ
jgi:hypothetical protein